MKLKLRNIYLKPEIWKLRNRPTSNTGTIKIIREKGQTSQKRSKWIVLQLLLLFFHKKRNHGYCFICLFSITDVIFTYHSFISTKKINTMQGKLKGYRCLILPSMVYQLCGRGISFIDGGNQSTKRKPSTCCKSLINFICAVIKLALVVKDTDCILCFNFFPWWWPSWISCITLLVDWLIGV